MKRSEYSHLRATAEKRISRLKEAGFASPVKSFPTLKELSKADFKTASRQLTKFLSNKLTTVRGARAQAKVEELRAYQRAEREERRKAQEERRETRQKRLINEQIEGRRLLGLNPKELNEEQKAVRRRYQQRLAKRRQRARERASEYGWTDEQQDLYKAAQTLGLKLKPSDIQAFSDYVEMRYNMVKESAQYVIDKYAKDYDKLLQKGKTPEEIAQDFRAYQKEVAETKQSAAELKNAVSEEEMSSFIERLLAED